MLTLHLVLPTSEPGEVSMKSEARHERRTVASYRQDREKRFGDGIPSLDDVEPGKIVGAVLPMSEQAQTQMRESIEVIDYLLNQERVVWS
jgi:hypothetical protein